MSLFAWSRALNICSMLLLLTALCIATAAQTSTSTSSTASTLPSSTTTNDARVDVEMCVYPVSGQYGMLPRFLYYFSILFAIVAHRFEWLVVGAIVSAMIFSATAVLHLLVILTQARAPVIDLDVIAIVLLCCVGVTMVSPALAWSNALKESAARTIVLRWGGMLVVGGLFGTFLHFGKLGALKTVWRNCIDLSGTPLTTASQLAIPSASFNCTYACFSATPSSIREASETMVQKYNSNDRNWSFWLWMGAAIVSYVFGLFAMAGNVDAHSGDPSWMPFMHDLSAGAASLSCVLVIVLSEWLFLHTGLYPGRGAVRTPHSRPVGTVGQRRHSCDRRRAVRSAGA